MKRVAFLVMFLVLPLFAGDVSQAKIAKLSKKGEKIAKVFCHEDQLPDPHGSIEDLMGKIKDSKACSPLSPSKLEALAYYLNKGSAEATGKEIIVPKGAKCPVCGMFVSKYPKWAALMIIDGKKYYFDGVKDMMKYYIFDADFPYDRNHIDTMQATDFYTLESIPAKEAFYVIGSSVYGPMGNELVPFKSLKDAENFKRDHKGEKIVRFDEITPKMVMALDGVIGVVYEEQK